MAENNSLIGGIAGAIIGFVVSGFQPSGAYYGWAVGSTIGAMTQPGPDPVQGPTIADRGLGAQSYGEDIPEGWGVYRVRRCSIIDQYPELIPLDGGIVNGVQVTEYAVIADFLLVDCYGRQGPIGDVLKIFMDGKLVYDLTVNTGHPTEPHILPGFSGAVTIYRGTEDQVADPQFVALRGADNVPAYLGVAHMVLRWNVSQFGNRVPVVDAICVSGSSAQLDDGWQRILLDPRLSGDPLWALRPDSEVSGDRYRASSLEAAKVDRIGGRGWVVVDSESAAPYDVIVLSVTTLGTLHTFSFPAGFHTRAAWDVTAVIYHDWRRILFHTAQRKFCVYNLDTYALEWTLDAETELDAAWDGGIFPLWGEFKTFLSIDSSGGIGGASDAIQLWRNGASIATAPLSLIAVEGVTSPEPFVPSEARPAYVDLGVINYGGVSNFERLWLAPYHVTHAGPLYYLIALKLRTIEVAETGETSVVYGLEADQLVNLAADAGSANPTRQYVDSGSGLPYVDNTGSGVKAVSLASEFKTQRLWASFDVVDTGVVGNDLPAVKAITAVVQLSRNAPPTVTAAMQGGSTHDPDTRRFGDLEYDPTTNTVAASADGYDPALVFLWNTGTLVRDVVGGESETLPANGMDSSKGTPVYFGGAWYVFAGDSNPANMVRDLFDRAAEDPLSNAGVWYAILNTSDALRTDGESAIAGSANAWLASAGTTDIELDMQASAVLGPVTRSASTSGTQLGVAVRVSTSNAAECYAALAVINDAGSDQLVIVKFSGSAPSPAMTVLATDDVADFAEGDTLSLRTSGTLLTATRGSDALDVVDASYAAGSPYTRAGLVINAQGAVASNGIASFTAGYADITLTLGSLWRYRVGILELEPVKLSEILYSLGERTGELTEEQLTSAELDALDARVGTIHGFLRSKRMSPRQAIAPLQPAYFFDICPSDSVIKFVGRGIADPVVTIDADDLGAQVGETAGPAFSFEAAPLTDAPRMLGVRYIALDQDHNPGGPAYSIIATGGAYDTATVEIPVALTDADAVNIAMAMHADALLQRQPIRLTLPASYDYLEPTDAVAIERGDTIYRLRIDEKKTDPQGQIDLTLVIESASPWNREPLQPTVTVVGGQDGAQTVGSSPPTSIVVEDMVSLNGASGFGVQFSSSDSAIVLVADREISPGTYGGGLTATAGSVIIGTRTGLTFDAPDTTADWDESQSLEIELPTALASLPTDSAPLMMVVGEEVLYASGGSASGLTYTFTRLLRGRRGTESFMDGHEAARERVYVVPAPATAFVELPTSASLVDAALVYRVRRQNAIPFALVSRSYAARAARPYAPANVRAGWVDGFLRIEWDHRSRRTAEWITSWLGAGPSEGAHNYTVKVYDDGTFSTVLRTATVDAATFWEYDMADILDDFGALQTTWYLGVTARGSAGGWPAGFEARATITTP